jgi:hypothetical protein
VIITLLHAAGSASAEPAGVDDLEHQLVLLDRVSYHPNLLPLVLQNADYLELSAAQLHRLRDWRQTRAPAMLAKLKQLVQGRNEFVDLSLDPGTTSTQLENQQQRLFRLQEQVLAYKLECRKNILETFTHRQWEDLQFILAERQAANP